MAEDIRQWIEVDQDHLQGRADVVSLSNLRGASPEESTVTDVRSSTARSCTSYGRLNRQLLARAAEGS